MEYALSPVKEENRKISGFVRCKTGYRPLYTAYGNKGGTMLVIGAQIRAARDLARLTQKQVAEAAGINVDTLSDMEARGHEPMTSRHQTVLAVQRVLEAAGVEFLDGDSPGVRLRPKKG